MTEWGWALKAVQGYAWAVFFTAWVQMGWVDWTQQKIRNRYLILWLKFILAGYALLGAHSLLGGLGLWSGYLMSGYYADLLVYVLFSMLAAALLWRLGVWPAGDVKLFALLALYYPLMRIPGSFRSGLRFLEIMINVFVPAAALLFVRAAGYLWRTRFKNQKDFLVELGLRRIWPYLAGKSREALALVKTELASWVEAYRESPWRLPYDAVSYLAMMGVMSMISYALSDLLRSNVLKTLVCFGLFFAWSRFCVIIGRGRALALVFLACAVFLLSRPAVDWALLGQSFGHISVFSLCLFFGIQIAFKVVAGQTGFMFLPVVFLIPSLVPWWWFKTLSLPGAAELASGLGVPPWFWEAYAELMLWALMGLFFGLSLVFVRIWDSESYQSVNADQIRPFMNLGPSLVGRLRQDEEFFEESIGTLYADGLTPDQAEALKEWCRRERVRSVPLAPTISFANWIFTGYFLTLLMDGHVLKFVY